MEQLIFALSTFLNGLQFGVFLFLVSAGLTLVLGIMSMVNLLHGSMFMMGAYFAAWLYGLFSSLGLGLEVSFLAAVACALPLTLLLGVALEFLALRTLYDRDHLDQVLATFGGILFFNQLVLVTFGAESQEFKLAASIDHPMTIYMSVVLLFIAMITFFVGSMIHGGLPFRKTVAPSEGEEKPPAIPLFAFGNTPQGRLVFGGLIGALALLTLILTIGGSIGSTGGWIATALLGLLAFLIAYGNKRTWATAFFAVSVLLIVSAIYSLATDSDVPFDYPSYRLYVIVAGILVAIGLYLVIAKTKVGMLIRAGASNRTMVTALGVNIILLFTIVFGIGAALAGFAGSMIGPLESVESQMGEEKLILAFVVIVIGGIGSIRGAFIASIIIGLVEIFGRSYMPQILEQVMESDAAQTLGPALASMTIYILMAAVLIFKPEGLFPARTG